MKESVQPGVQCVTRDPSLFHGVLANLSECSKVTTTEVKELQTLDEVNNELLRSLRKGLKRNEQLKLLFDKKRTALEAQRLEFEEEMKRKLNFIERGQCLKEGRAHARSSGELCGSAMLQKF